MEYTTLTGTEMNVSRLCLGTMTFGDQVDEADGAAIIRRAIDAGINFIDTADVYQKGASESIIGKGLRGIRGKVVLASKVGSRMHDGPNGAGLGRGRILSMLENSLRRLKTDFLDLYYLHKPDAATPLEETLAAMDGLARSGMVRYWGLSNFAAWQVVKILWLCDKHGWIAPTATQNIHNLITRGVERELVPCLLDSRLSMVIYSPLASGMLTGKHKPGAPAEHTRFAVNKQHYNRYWTDFNFAAVERLKSIAAGSGMTLPELAMRWCLARPGTDSVITGVSRLGQLESNLRCLDTHPLAESVMPACDEVWKELDDKSFQYNR